MTTFRDKYADIGRHCIGRELHMTNEGMEIDLSVDQWSREHGSETSIAWLECYVENQKNTPRFVIGLRLRNTHSVPFDLSTDSEVTDTELRMHTQVEAREMSTVEERLPSVRRLIKIGEGLENFVHERLLIYREATPLERTQVITRPVFVELDLTRVNTFEDEWRIVTAYPRAQWFQFYGDITLPLRRTAAFGAITIQRQDGYSCVVIIGVHLSLNSAAGASVSGLSSAYWILPYTPCLSDTADEVEPDLDLHRLCNIAGTFKSKDYFERNTSRWDCLKFVSLPGTQVLLRGSFEDGDVVPDSVGFRSVLKLYTTPLQGGQRMGPFAERDYFQLTRKRQPVLKSKTHAQKPPKVGPLLNGDPALESDEDSTLESEAGSTGESDADRA